MPRDLREKYFGGLDWYEALERPMDLDEPSAWFTAKNPVQDCHAMMLNAGLKFAEKHSLFQQYRVAFAGIKRNDLLPERARAEARNVGSPISEIANELAVASFLERVLDWRYLAHEPLGRGERRGDWAFRSKTGHSIFVEVKTLTEPLLHPDALHGIRPSDSIRKRIRSALARAYRQLPVDGFRTLVVLVGDDLLTLPGENIAFGDVFQALFGELKFSFTLSRPEKMRLGPSFREMFVQSGKHRRLGCVAGMRLSGAETPAPRMYAIHNPFAYEEVLLRPDDLASAAQFFVNSDGDAVTLEGITGNECWRRIERARLRRN